MEASAKTDILTLPVQVASRVDVGRLLREVEALDNFLSQSAIREPGTPVKLPKTSRLLDEFIMGNKLNALHAADRKRMRDFLANVRTKAPVLHMSFSADPSPSFIQKLMTWLRQEIHPMVLLQVGLQPNIGAGAVLRTTNKHFDFSLRQRFKKERDNLVARLDTIAEKPGPAVSTPAATTPDPTPPPAPVQPQQPTPEAPAPPEVPSVPAPETETPEQLAKEVEAAIAQLDPGKAAPAQAPAAQPPQGAPHA